MTANPQVQEGLIVFNQVDQYMTQAVRMICSVMLGWLLAGCASGMDRWVELDGTRYEVEVAADESSRAQGLMYRDSLADGHGMLFIHDSEEPQAYWMKNTRIPLDILYFDNARRLVSQQRDVPPCSAGDRCPPYPSGAPARYVLELNAGQAAGMGLQDGVLLEISPAIAAPAAADDP